MAISQKDIKLLWSKAAGRCAICRRELAQDKSIASASIVIGEQAHIVAEENDGPRGRSILSLTERNSYFNLILLCPNHHTIIDKSEEDYPVEKLHLLKREHELWVQSILSKEARRNEIDTITIDDFLEFHEKIRPIIFWLHRIVPKESAREYFAAMQEFWTTSNVAADHIPPKIRHALDWLLRPLAAEHYAFHGGRHYADSKISGGASAIMQYFSDKGIQSLMPDIEDKAEDILRDLNAYCEIVQLSSGSLTDVEIDIVKYIRQITQYYYKHFNNRGPAEIPDSFTDQFLALLSPFTFDKVGIVFPEKTDDRVLDRIKQYAGGRDHSF